MLFVAVLFGAVSASDIIVSVNAANQECFGEELSKSQLLIVKAETVKPAAKTFNLAVFSGISEGSGAFEKKFDRAKHKPVFQDEQKSQISTAFTTLSAGPHWVCIENTDYRESMDVALSIKYGAHAKDYSQIAKRDHLESSEVKLAEIHDVLKSYHYNMIFLREREDKLQSAHQDISSRVILFSGLNLAIVALVGALQFFYFKRFFKAKKII